MPVRPLIVFLRRAALALALGASPIAAQQPAPPPAPPPAGRTVRVPGAELWYREQGSGEPLVLLHGFLDCASSWDPFVAKLAERHRVILVELRGHGRSTNPSGAFTLRQSAADVTALLDSLRLPRVHAMGISAGAMTLLHVATAQPARLRSLVLVGATTRFVDQTRAAIRDVGGVIPAPVMAEFRKCASRGPAQVDDLLAQFQVLGRSTDDPNFSDADLARITAPTLVVHGDRDEFFPVELALGLYRGIPKAQLWVVPNGDHVPIYGPTTPFADVALRFLQRAAPKP
ncbi:alpha/beta hydrolase [Roseisolibacter sp. H3M3-2]|uniref:alpha/beta fold hydrolase n=1 Tax=Roseisolibacter sp. H3M3-2 TaxID=3031323 RepID=UPI0023D9BD01|nr:alpha/beta hydrolase [Roseisolibacter sp. H3M3-2]MDF1504380.1 alpha/beta hydrolase [Roseisolibacter sp. H3M3-2]